MSQPPTQHLNWLSRFCTAHPSDQHTQTNKQTDHATCDMTPVAKATPMHCPYAMLPKSLTLITLQILAW